MQNFFGVKVDTANMTTEELLEAKNKIRLMLSNIEHQLLLRKMAERKHSSEVSPRWNLAGIFLS